MSSNIFWTPEEDEILIDFVRNHDVLYNIRHPDYRKAQTKQHLWESIGTTLEKSEILDPDSNDDFGKMEEEKFQSTPLPKKKKLTHSEERFKLLKQIAERKVAPQNEPDEADLFFWIYGEDLQKISS
ncbi:hypothetical protein TNCV_2498481 [Trichonephila clavipes]|nr:hypothetical protein TNCV_2498481 [Trichonephila clavipes]